MDWAAGVGLGGWHKGWIGWVKASDLSFPTSVLGKGFSLVAALLIEAGQGQRPVYQGGKVLVAQVGDVGEASLIGGEDVLLVHGHGLQDTVLRE